MDKPNKLVDVNEGSTVSNASPQSPNGSALLETPITLDFDPMSFQFKEDSPLTSPSDNSREIGDMLSPSQNPDVVDFFDPFCPVKEESPTDYYPNVMLGQTNLCDPMLDTPEQQYANTFSRYEVQEEVCQDGIADSPALITIDDEDDVDRLNGLVGVPESVDDIPDSTEDIPESSEDIPEGLDVPECVEDVPDSTVDYLDNTLDGPDSTIDSEYAVDMSDARLDGLNNEFDGLDEVKHENIVNNEDVSDEKYANQTEKPDELIVDFCPSSELSTVTSSRSEISADVDLLTELEQTRSEDTCVSPVNEQVFDDNKHDDSISQHDECQMFENDVSLTLICFL